MKHCLVCYWSFGAVTEDESSELKPVLKCWPRGDRKKEQLAIDICQAYRPEGIFEQENEHGE